MTFGILVEIPSSWLISINKINSHFTTIHENCRLNVYYRQNKCNADKILVTRENIYTNSINTRRKKVFYPRTTRKNEIANTRHNIRNRKTCQFCSIKTKKDYIVTIMFYYLKIISV